MEGEHGACGRHNGDRGADELRRFSRFCLKHFWGQKQSKYLDMDLQGATRLLEAKLHRTYGGAHGCDCCVADVLKFPLIRLTIGAIPGTGVRA